MGGLGPIKSLDECDDFETEFCEATDGGGTRFFAINVVINVDGGEVDAPPFQQAYAGVEGVESEAMHAVLISRDGRVFITGSNIKGQLCLGAEYDSTDFVEDFHEVPGISNAREAAVGQEFTLIMTDDGDVYGCGSNELGQLGLGRDTEAANEPTQIQGLGFINSMSVGLSFALFLDKSEGIFWGTGSNSFGQQCFFTEGEPTRTVTEMVILGDEKVVQVQSGRESSYLLMDDGGVLSCGNNDRGQLGDGTTDNTSREQPIVRVAVSEEVFGIGSGPGSKSVFFIGYDNVYAVGANDFFQLGIGENEEPETPTRVEFDGPVDINVVSCSGSHTVALHNL